MFDEICNQGAAQACSTLGAPHTCVVQRKAMHMRRGTLHNGVYTWFGREELLNKVIFVSFAQICEIAEPLMPHGLFYRFQFQLLRHSSCIAVYAGQESSRICAFGMTLGRVINARIVIFVWTNPLKQTAINHSTFFHVHCILPTIVVTLTEELQKAEEITSELIVSHDLLTYAKEGNMWQHITYRWTCCDTDHRFSVAAIWLELNS